MDDICDDDVLSLSAHESWSTEGKSELSELDMETAEFIVVDEVGEEQMEVASESSPGSDVRAVVHEVTSKGHGADFSSRALGSVEDSVSSTGILMSASERKLWTKKVTQATVLGANVRAVVDEGIGKDLVAGSSSRALGSVEDPASSSSGILVPTPKSRLKVCYVCGLETRERMRRHVLKCHLPWFWSATTACWECGEQELQASSLAVRHSNDHKVGCGFDDGHLHLWCLLLNGSLHLLASWLDCDGLDSLLTYVTDRKLHEPLRSGFSDQEMQFLMFFVQTYSPHNVPEIVFRPPNHVACLTNWEFMASLLRRVSPARQRQFVTYSEFLTYEGNSTIEPVPLLPEPFLFVDSHFHLELVLHRLRFRNFLHMQSVISPCDNTSGLYYGITNFVFPHHWKDWRTTIGYARTIFVTFGIHPHVASDGLNPSRRKELECLLKEDLCVAIGEIGLDFTTTCKCHPGRSPPTCVQRMKNTQEQVLVELLTLARRHNLPVVLHCRDNGDGSAAARVFELIVRYGFSDLQFHRHCFVGSPEELRQWLTLPGVIFGVTWKTVTVSADVIPRIPFAKLVLESDAPFLSPVTCGPTNHPWNLRFVAEQVAKLRNLPLSVLTSTVNKNALVFYKVSEKMASSCH